MRFALLHAKRLTIEPGAPAVADPGEWSPIERADCLLALAGVEPADPADGTGAERVRETAADLRCGSVVLAFCPALVDTAADRERAADVLRALEGVLGDDAAVVPTDRYPASDVETAGHPHAVRSFRPGETAAPAFDPSPLEAAGLANATDAGLAWTPAGTVARRALVGAVAERFARAGAEPVDPPLPSGGANERTDSSVLRRPPATLGAEPETAVYAAGAAFENGVVRPEALDPEGDLDAWLELTNETLRALGFTPEVSGRATATDVPVVEDALGAPVTGGDTTRIEFRTAGPTGVVERVEGAVHCAPVGTARRALAALDPLPVSLAPTQLRLMPIDGAGERCRALAARLAARADVDDRDVPTGERLADADGIPFVAVVGPEDDALPVAGPDGQERRPEDELDARVRREIPSSAWPPVRARRPLRLSARRR